MPNLERNKLFEVINKYRDSIKIAVETDQRSVTYKDLNIEVHKLSAGIKRMNSKNTIIFIHNSIEFITAYFALVYNNSTIIPLYYELSIRELIETYDFCDVQFIITNSDGIRKIKNGNELFFDNSNFFNIDKNEFYLNSKLEPNDNNEECKAGVILRTSGSTSNPKYVQLSKDSIINNVIANIQALDISNIDRSLIILPMAFAYCFHSQLLSHLLVGATVILKPNKIYSFKGFVGLLNKRAITNFATIPAFLISYIKQGSLVDVNCLNKIYIGADFFSKDLRSKLQKKFPNTQLYITYGMTEAGPRISTLKYKEGSNDENSVGRTLNQVHVKIVDHENKSLEPYEKGEIVIATPSIMIGYYKNISLTTMTIKNSRLYTGDYGYLDEDKNLHLDGRIKNIIKVNGITINPEEIEECLLHYREIKDVYVTGEYSYISGQKIVAYIVCRHKELCVEEIIKYCKTQLSKEKVPDKIYKVEVLSKTSSGKIIRNRGGQYD